MGKSSKDDVIELYVVEIFTNMSTPRPTLSHRGVNDSEPFRLILYRRLLHQHLVYGPFGGGVSGIP